MKPNSRAYNLHFTKLGKARDWNSVRADVQAFMDYLGIRSQYPAPCRNFVNHIAPVTWLYLGVGKDQLKPVLEKSGDAMKETVDFLTSSILKWSRKDGGWKSDLVVNMIPFDQYGIYEPSHGGFAPYAEVWDNEISKGKHETEIPEYRDRKQDKDKKQHTTKANDDKATPPTTDTRGKKQDYMRAILKDIDPDGWFTDPLKAGILSIQNFKITDILKVILDVLHRIDEVCCRFWNVISPILGLYWGLLTQPDKTMASVQKHLPKDQGADTYHPDPSVGLVLGLPFIRDIARSVASQNLMYKYQARTGQGYADPERYILDSTNGLDPAVAIGKAAEAVIENAPEWFLND